LLKKKCVFPGCFEKPEEANNGAFTDPEQRMGRFDLCSLIPPGKMLP